MLAGGPALAATFSYSNACATISTPTQGQVYHDGDDLIVSSNHGLTVTRNDYGTDQWRWEYENVDTWDGLGAGTTSGWSTLPANPGDSLPKTGGALHSATLDDQRYGQYYANAYTLFQLLNEVPHSTIAAASNRTWYYRMKMGGTPQGVLGN